MHEFFQSVGQAIYDAISWLGGALRWLWNTIADWVMGLQTPTAMKFFSNDIFNNVLFFGIVIYLLIINIWALCLFKEDKKHAKKDKRRVKESKLFKICFFGGATGGIVGMYLFRHKTKKKKFTIGIPILFILQLILNSFILGFLGFWTFL